MQNSSELEAISIIRRQLEAYNRHDAAGFAACYTPAAQVFDLSSREISLCGRAAIQSHFEKRFDQPGLRVEIAGRMVLHGLVVDSERIITDSSEAPVEAVVIYEVQNGLINRSWIYRIPIPKG